MTALALFVLTALADEAARARARPPAVLYPHGVAA
jgi:hypothetical protein